MSFAKVPGNVWICCRCSVSNLQTSDPKKCPLCDHERCDACMVGKASFDKFVTPHGIDSTQYPPREDPATAQHPNLPGDLPGGADSPRCSSDALLAFDNTIFDNLAEQFGQKAAVTDHGIVRNPDITVLPGYELHSTMVSNPYLILNMKHKWESDPDLNAKFWTTSRGERVHYGFKPEDLITAEALRLDDSVRQILPSNLTTPIHAFFHLGHWTNLPNDVYNVLVPGLRLASIFLSHPRLMRWWCTVLMGKRETDPFGTVRMGRPAQRIKTHVPLTPENAENCIQYLDLIGNKITEDEGHVVNFRFIENLTSGDFHCFGTCSYINTWDGPEKERTLHKFIEYFAKKKMNRQFVRLHADFYIQAVKLLSTKFPDENQRLRFNFFFAVNLCHELAHAVEAADLFHGNETPYFVPEPCIGSDLMAESGNNWEKHTFGGRIQPINGDVGCKYGLSIMDWPPPGSQGWQSTMYTIPMDWIEEIQQQSFWDRNTNIDPRESQVDLEDWFRPPLRLETARGWGAPVTLTMAESEMAKEREEQLAHLDREEVEKMEADLRLALLKEVDDEKKREAEVDKAKEQQALYDNEWALDTLQRTRRGTTSKEDQAMTDILTSFLQPQEPQPPLRVRPSERPKRSRESERELRRSRSPGRSPKTGEERDARVRERSQMRDGHSDEESRPGSRGTGSGRHESRPGLDDGLYRPLPRNRRSTSRDFREDHERRNERRPQERHSIGPPVDDSGRVLENISEVPREDSEGASSPEP